MKLLGVLVLVFSASFVSSPFASADVTYSQKIEVHAVIAPARYIILNQQGQISQILSNTKQPVQPTVYKEAIKTENLTYLTADIESQYVTLLNGNINSIGVLYKTPSPKSESGYKRKLSQKNESLFSKPSVLPFLITH